MSSRQYTYEEVKRRFQSIAGMETLTAADEFFFENSINRAAYDAYTMSDFWPQYIVVGEERSVTGANFVSRSESEKDEIEEFLKIHKKEPYLDLSATEFDFYVDRTGAFLVNALVDESNKVYVTYKKIWDGPYDHTSTDIPGQFTDYIVLMSLSDFYQGDGQTENANNMLARAQRTIENEIFRNEVTKNRNIFGTTFKNHLSLQSR